MNHWVYYLYHPESNELLYIGRTCNLGERLRYFKKRTGIDPVVGACQRFSVFESAAAAELEAILEHRPPLNKVAISSRGCLGRSFNMPQAARKRISEAHKGKPKSQETKAKMKQAKSPEHRAKLSEVLKKARAARKMHQPKETQN